MRKFNILIVDDDISSIQLGVNVLKENDQYNIIFATSANEALQRVMDNEFDLILLDIIMQPIDGFEVCKKMRNIENLKDIPIIFLSSKDDKESIAKGFELGAVDYITKPFFAQELRARVDTHIHLKHYQDELKKELIIKQKYINHQEKIVQQQSRLAQMGEMISMIAHQWRQPLGAISSAILGIQTKKDSGRYDLYNANDMEKYMKFCDKKYKHISQYVQFLSTTIDDFRNFFKPDKQKEKVTFCSPVEKALKIIGVSMTNKGIEIDTDFSFQEDIEIYQNEFMQVILNILKNAEDHFIEKNISNPKITIKTLQKDDYAIIRITDNGGGIPQSIIEKIFDPYFSTKNEKNGSGLGLYMSKTMIEEHHHGKLSVNNIDDGACFEIKIKIV